MMPGLPTVAFLGCPAGTVFSCFAVATGGGAGGPEVGDEVTGGWVKSEQRGASGRPGWSSQDQEATIKATNTRVPPALPEGASLHSPKPHSRLAPGHPILQMGKPRLGG